MQALTTTLLSLLLTMALAATAFAQATINDCEKIQAADAYNQCLAKFGPPMKSGNLEPERPGDIKSSGEEAAAGAGPAKGHGGRVAGKGRRGRVAVVSHRGHGRSHVARGSSHAHQGGRKRMTISVGK